MTREAQKKKANMTRTRTPMKPWQPLARTVDFVVPVKKPDTPVPKKKFTLTKYKPPSKAN